MSMKTVLSPRMEWQMARILAISDLFTASGSGEYSRISSIFTPSAPFLLSLRQIFYTETKLFFTSNCFMSTSDKTKPISSSNL